MPIYEYQCPECQRVHEIWRRVSETEVSRCPECAIPMQRLVSRSSFQLRGGGWYADGYCRKTEQESLEENRTEQPSCAARESAENEKCAACSG